MSKFFIIDPKLLGPLYAMGAMFCFSLNDVSIKYLASEYPLHEVILIRSSLSVLFIVLFLFPFNGGLSAIKTNLLAIHIIRGCCIVLANMFMFMGLAALPIADAVAIFFISPLLITILSIIFLKEHVGIWRWISIFIGLLGVLIISRPGSSAFQIAAIYPMFGALGYAFLHILTRKIRATESAATMAFYIQFTFVIVACLIGLILGDGRLDISDDPSLSFLLRKWIIPNLWDYWIFLLIGLATALGGLLISQAYRTGEAAYVAPFEYIALPISILWGITIFSEWPILSGWIGIFLILSSGLFMIWRESIKNKR
ncbi:MAG: DMT family transporter [Paracoccaceae bacterium]|nr:DMT family transporter [Paracoccaceae bacterium]